MRWVLSSDKFGDFPCLDWLCSFFSLLDCLVLFCFMASPSRSADLDIEDISRRLNVDLEEVGLVIEDTDLDVQTEDFRWCLVGRILIDKVVNFRAMKNTLASLWKPVKGVCIKELELTDVPEAPRYLFQFFHKVNMNRVVDSGPWSFDNHTLLVHRLKENEQPGQVLLFNVDFWVQVYKLPIGFVSKKIACSIGNYIGKFVHSDPTNYMGTWRNYLRVRVSIDVRKPLRQSMKIKKQSGSWVELEFKYEQLGQFCFVCGLFGHLEHFFPKHFEDNQGLLISQYGPELHAQNRRNMNVIGERWLRSSPPMGNNLHWGDGCAEMETEFSARKSDRGDLG